MCLITEWNSTPSRSSKPDRHVGSCWVLRGCSRHRWMAKHLSIMAGISEMSLDASSKRQVVALPPQLFEGSLCEEQGMLMWRIYSHSCEFATLISKKLLLKCLFFSTLCLYQTRVTGLSFLCSVFADVSTIKVWTSVVACSESQGPVYSAITVRQLLQLIH